MHSATWVTIVAGALLSAFAPMGGGSARAAGPFDGRFSGADGELVLHQSGSRVTGSFIVEGMELSVAGTVSNGRLSATITFPGVGEEPFVGEATTGGLVLRVEGDPEGSFFRRVGGGEAPPPDPRDAPPSEPPDPGSAWVPGDPSSGASAGGAALGAKGPAARGAKHESPYEGWRLNVPRGWKHVDKDGAVLMGSDTEPGLIAVRFTPLTDPRALQQGLSQILGSMGQFAPSPALSKVKLAGGVAWYTEAAGIAQDGSRLRARAVGVVGKLGTVAILGITADDDAKMAALAKRVDAIARSVRHFAPKVSAGQRVVAGEWWSFAGGSTATSHGGTERTYGFCRDGTFSSSRESSYTGGLDTGGTYTGPPGHTTDEGGWHGISTSSGRGRWVAIGDVRSGTIRITYPDGSTQQISYEAAPQGDMKFDGRLFGRKAQGLCR